MRTGNLRHIVTIQRQSTTQDAAGQPVDTWTDVVTRRASIEPLNGREYFTASGEQSRVTTRIRMRFDSTVGTVQTNDRIIDATRSPQAVYDIVSPPINPMEKNHEVIFMARRDG